MGKIREELDTLKKTESLRRKNIETLSRSVEKLEAIVANKPDTADLSDIPHMLVRAVPPRRVRSCLIRLHSRRRRSLHSGQNLRIRSTRSNWSDRIP